MTGISKKRNGWTGEKCGHCNGSGEGDTDYPSPCGACGGTGEEYDATQDDRTTDADK